MDLYGPPSGLSQSHSSSESPLDSNAGDYSSSNPFINSGSTTGPPSVQDQASQLSSPVSSVPAACLACRSKHLKCDGNTPCVRCVGSQSECVYVASRRGYKGPRRGTAQNPNKRHASSSPDASGDVTTASGPASCPMLLGATAPPLTSAAAAVYTPTAALGTDPGSSFLTAAASMNHLQLYRTSPFVSSIDDAVQQHGPIARVISIADKCFDSYYYHYYASHPFVLPKEYLLRHIRESGQKLDHLMAAMRYVGSLYLDVGPVRASYLDEALRLCYAANAPKDGFLVQALLLLIVALDGSCQQDKARDLLTDCERIAVEIGLNTRQFATLHGQGNPVLEESWRRTWWDLYVCDGMIAGVHRITNFLLFDMAADVALPCEEYEYLSGASCELSTTSRYGKLTPRQNIPQPMYLEDFDDQLFSGEDRPFSSFAYRVAAIRNLGRFMRCPPILFPEDDNMTKVETLLTNWRLHLPPGKRDPVDKNCLHDEMMFQAHFITTACTIMLHQPHSQLDSSPARSVNSCAPYRAIPSGDVFNIHTRHTVTAASEISKMITAPVPLTQHTHFFTCVITMSAIVQLSKWALYFIQDEDDLRQQIRLSIGALSKLSAVWKAAGTAAGQVKGVAQEIYRAKKAAQVNPAFWVAFTQQEMISNLNADEGIMSEIDSMLSQVTSAPGPSGPSGPLEH
ncbi:Activator of stress genes 1 [Cytospora mali]|uniref:Activator of stress genes 1 n=1 Tax=Cytospora mali TaxID=578113 RepID=A0A194UVA5_CYTMA|nr:Activator of stress genes 1 [Valsa mali var. pyri (nom. inval.)]